jgi:hypothetical protein
MKECYKYKYFRIHFVSLLVLRIYCYEMLTPVRELVLHFMCRTTLEAACRYKLNNA